MKLLTTEMDVNHNPGSPRVSGYRWGCLSLSWHLLMSILIDVSQKGARDRSSLTDLRPTCRVTLTIGFSGSFR
jgi:hypothetical protein